MTTVTFTKEFKKEAEVIKRPGIKDLISYLESTDFFTAPASTRFHGAHEAGLVLHCLSVLDVMKEMNKFFEKLYTAETVAICALFHDICKANFYTRGLRNKKINGKWESVEVWEVKDQLPMGHGEKSVYLIQKHMTLTDEEALAIRWHMTGADPGVHFNYPSGAPCSQAMRENKLIALLSSSDLAASYLMETWPDKEKEK